jgi:cyclic pyranopterin phosphate synthase
MRDSFSRKINYLRISITDRCNLRCGYCLPEKFSHYSRNEILSYEEFLRICAIAARLGAENFRVTGGEPLVRKDCLQFIQNLKNLKTIPGAKTVTLTTNGVLLSDFIPALADAKIDGINISLDSVCKQNYKKITGIDSFENVWQSLLQAMEYNIPVKINSVLIKNVNEHEILPIAGIAEKFPVHVRFIELMPTINNKNFTRVSSTEVMKILKLKYEDLQPDKGIYGAGPARYYGSEKLKGKIGLISPLDQNFCGGCNRLRVSSTGFLRLCLHHNNGIDLRRLLRNGASDDEIEQEILLSIKEKPARHFLENKTNLRDMWKIGG